MENLPTFKNGDVEVLKANRNQKRRSVSSEVPTIQRGVGAPALKDVRQQKKIEPKSLDIV